MNTSNRSRASSCRRSRANSFESTASARSGLEASHMRRYCGKPTQNSDHLLLAWTAPSEALDYNVARKQAVIYFTSICLRSGCLHVCKITLISTYACGHANITCPQVSASSTRWSSSERNLVPLGGTSDTSLTRRIWTFVSHSWRCTSTSTPSSRTRCVVGNSPMQSCSYHMHFSGSCRKPLRFAIGSNSNSRPVAL